ncbi:biotin/lipoyl-containing protein [Geobacter argillaceus]|uniref:Biotin-dependent enzyme n=1 Tax=Geobacter argillaceus TaxID=345631 RepID=A0A562VMY6_9BACT|nr:acetyl-CoA carboxylase biotin carboxyl carrier protein subunit [Geobacter argillaceus]TWJ19346.1 biotin-dependent enzyme [Geobacter argillaceus]
MTYVAICNGEKSRVRVVETAPGRYRVEAGDTAYLVDFREPQPNLYSLILDGRSYEVDIDVDERSDLFMVDINGDHFEIELVDEKKQRLALKSVGGLSGRQEIRAPMAGNVWKVLVNEGDRVGVGQTVIILEAMKMENEIKAPMAGIISSLAAREGVPVFAGDQLCIVEPAEEESSHS